MNPGTAPRIREEALLILHGRGAILEIAREISDLLRAENLAGVIIGGVAVTLHGHVRTTVDVDLYVADTVRVGEALSRHGFTFDAQAKQFVKNDVPVHLVTISQLKVAPRSIQDIEGIRTVALADLINMKLRSGTLNVLRAQDLADVIGLIRANRLESAFVTQIDKELRREFRKLAKAVAEESDEP